jgi:hypothetical protein
MGGEVSAPVPDYYADVAVIACRLPESDLSVDLIHPKITSSDGNFTLNQLIDGDVSTSSFLPAAPVGTASWIMYEFKEPLRVQAVTIVGGSNSGMFGPPQETRALEISNDGKTFQKVMDLPQGALQERTFSFNPVKARFFRVSWTKLPAQARSTQGMGGFGNAAAPAGPSGTQVSEFALHTAGFVNRFEEKAAFVAATDLYQAFTKVVEPGDVIKSSDVIDISSRMSKDGQLNWTPPNGKWMVLRLGYSLTGHQNSPASPEATGLEVDKLSAKHVNAYFTNYLDQYKDATKGLMGQRGLQYVITDSWEAGTQNWTDNMITEFRNRRGYDMIPWIPVLTGHIVESAEASDKFLWDFRKTLADLVAINHYDQLTQILKARGMGRYSESHEARRAFIGDGMEAKRTADIPMGAGWTPGGFGGNEESVATVYQADIRESASVSHLYGKTFVGAESLSAMGTDWAWSPELLKPIADHLMASGLNRFIIHTSVHQPLMDKLPGFSLGPFGQWFTRNETWAEKAIAWTTYLSRSCFMLQQGKYVADIAYYYGEDNNITVMFNRMRGNGGGLPEVPEGYSYDFLNADALVNLLSVNEGSLVTPSGMHYKLMVLDPNSQYMTLTVLRKLRDLVKEGAVVSGPKPIQTPSLSDDPTEFNAIVGELWTVEKGMTKYGKGKVYAGESMGDVLNSLSIIPDFAYSKPKEDTKMFFVHRRIKDMDIYWVNNRKARTEDIEATFKTTGKVPEIWHPETGTIEKASYRIENEVTTVQLSLVPEDAIFVVFNNKATENVFKAPAYTEKQLIEVNGPWTVDFQENRGAPAQAIFASLTPWNENTDKGIKYFSGTGTYSKTITAPAEWFKGGSEIWLDLGSVKDLAEVHVNGTTLGIVWKPPFKVNMTGVLKPGENKLDIQVTNLWVNRLIGDRQPDAQEKITYTITEPYKADSPLKTTGLLGPVIIFERSHSN